MNIGVVNSETGKGFLKSKDFAGEINIFIELIFNFQIYKLFSPFTRKVN
jgi:hypothetical protein